MNRKFVLGVVCLVVVGAACGEQRDTGEDVGVSQQRLSSNQHILGFERVSSDPTQSDWVTTGGGLSSSATFTEGSHALGIANIGWAQLTSAPLSALGSVSSSVRFDVRVPGSGPIPWGDVQLSLQSPTLGIWNQPVGQRLLGGTTAGAFQTIELPLSSDFKAKLSSAGYADLVVKIAINVPSNASPVLVDRLTFGEQSGGSGGAGGTGSGSSGAGAGGSTGSGAASGSGGASGSAAQAGSGGTSAGSSGSGSGATSSGGGGGIDAGPCTLASPSVSATTPYQFFIKLPAGVARGDVLFGATNGSVQVDDGVKAQGTTTPWATVTSVAAASDSRIGVGAETFDVFSDKGIVLANRSHVYGSARATTTISRQPDTIVDGLVLTGSNLSPIRTIDWTVPFPTLNRGSCSLEPGATQQLRPAAYGGLSVKTGSRLKLTPGTYFFESLVLEPGATLELQNTDTLVIYVRGTFTFRGRIEEAQNKGNVLFGVAGTSGVDLGAPFRGVVVAPWATIDLATSSSAPHVGAFFGRVVTAHQWTTTTLRPFEAGDACGDETSCGSFCPCKDGSTCETDADCADGLVCPPGNGPRYGRRRGTSVCELPDCRFKRRDLGCGFAGATCGSNCDDGLPCTSAADCPSNEICATGRGPLTASESANVCMPPACLDQPAATGCGATTDLCGECACTPTCATKQCGDDAADGCGGRCRELCDAREPGCTADADCPDSYACIVGGGPRIGLAANVNVCLPLTCISPNPKHDCGQLSSVCGLCPVVPSDVCDGRECGVDPSFGTSCGPAGPPGLACVQGISTTGLESHELELDTTNRSSDEPLAIAPLPVTEPATESAVGALDGSFGVSDRGTANYTIPIVVPPGRDGMEPDLSLHYSGGQANGSVGVGWSVDGLSSIARCPKIAATEDWPAPVQYDLSDRFCMDGKRLVLTSGQYGVVNSTYRTEIDSLDRVELLASPIDAQPFFKVKKKNGRILSYGLAANSRIYREVAKQIVRVWGLSRIQDRVGNIINFEYGKFESAETRHLVDTKGEPIVDVEDQTVEFFLKSVAYGGLENDQATWDSRRLVEFEYDPYRFDYMDGSTRGGARVARTQLLKKITTSVGGAPVRSYELEYGGVGLPGPLNDYIQPEARTKRLKLVRECSGKHGSRVCKRPTTFDYLEEHGIEATPQVTALPQLALTGTRPVVRLDWNGDGRDDLLVGPDWKLLVATGNRVGAAFTHVPMPPLTGPIGATHCISQNSVADLNGDGRDDLFAFCGYERFHKQWWSTADVNRPFQMVDGPEKDVGAMRSFLVDINADGASDLFMCSDQNRAYFRLRNGDSLEPELLGVIPAEEQWSVCLDNPMMVQDIDGDGAGEVLIYRKPYQDGPGESHVSQPFWARYAVSVSEEFGIRASWQPVWMPLTQRAYKDGAFKFIDVNGDGLKDLLYLDDDVARTPLLSINHAGAFMAARPAFVDWGDATSRAGVFPTLYSIRTGLALDYDGNGSQDLLRRFDWRASNVPFSRASLWQWDRSPLELTKYAALVGDGIMPDATSFRFAPQPGVMPAQDNNILPVLADVDADGSQDLVQFDSIGNLYVHHGYFKRESLLKTVTDGLGKRVDIRYDAVRIGANGAEERVYTPTDICRTIEQEWTTHCLHNPGPLVSEYQTSFEDSPGHYKADRKTRLSYADAREGVFGRGWYGFGRRVMEELAPDNSLIRQTEVISDVRPRSEAGARFYPLAGRETRRTVLTAPDKSEIEAQPAYTRFTRNNSWKTLQSAQGGPIAYVQTSTENTDEVTSGGDIVSVLEESTVNDIDWYGNLRSSLLTVRRDNVVIANRSQTISYHTDGAHLGSWLVSLPDRYTLRDIVHDSTVEEPDVQRTTQFVFDQLGLPIQTIREPDEPADSSLRRVTTFARSASDPSRRVKSVLIGGSWGAGADEVSAQRVTSIEYDDEAIFPKRIKQHVGCDADGEGCRDLVTDVRLDPRDGTLLGVVDPAGVGSQAAYDSFGRLLKEVRAAGTTTLEYQDGVATTVNGRQIPAKLQITEHQLATGATSTRRFDSLGRVVQTSSSGFEQPSILQEFGYIWGGLLDYASRPHLPGDATQGATTQTYDARWRLRRRTFSDATFIELADGRVGNLNAGAEVGEIAATGARDQRGNWTYAFTDFRGSTRRTIDELGHATRYSYDAFGTLALIADYRANLTRLRTDKLGRVLEHEDADTGLQEYSYTAFDEIFTHIDGPEDALRIRKHSYDELGRLATVTAPEGPTYFSYDGPGDNTAGRLVETTSPSGATEHYEYQPFPADGDPMKNAGFVEEVSRLIDGTTYVTKLGYDATTHQLNRVEYPASGDNQPFAVRYAYDAFGNLKSVTGTNAERTSEASPLWRLDEAYQGSAIQKETYGNGVSSSYTYEQATGRLKTALTRGGPGNPVLQDLRYDSYDNNGNLKSRHSTFKRVGSNTTDTYADTFNYDQLDRLDDYSVDGVTADVNYDELGNITFRTGIGSYSYLDPAKTYRPHAVLGLTKNGAKVANFEYDDYGNIKRRSGEGVAGGTQEFTHTSFNLPSTITLGEGANASQVRYEYDAGQKRVLLAVGDCESNNNPTCNKRVYVGGAYERQTATDAGGPVTRHAYKVFAGSRQVAQIEREQRSGATVETRRYLHDDHLGSSQLITNETGELTQVQRVDPFGAPADTPGSAPDASSARIRTGFTGHETDPETGLVNMRGRLYDARIGRFMQADPPFMESPGWSQGLNRYSYVFNNPLNAVDPSGLYAETEDDTTVEDSEEVIWDPTCQGPGCDSDGSVDTGSVHDNDDDEAETSPGQGDPTDESAVGGRAEGLSDAQKAAARHEAYKAAAYAEDRANAQRGKDIEGPDLDDLQNLLDVTSISLDATGVGAGVSWIPDLFNAGVSYGRGDNWGGGMSLAAAAPLAGAAANGLRLGRAATRGASKALRKALKAAGHVPGANSAAHHIVAVGAEAAAPARAVLEKFGVGINKAENGVFLPQAASAGTSATVHAGGHSGAYYDAVNEALAGATTRDEVIQVLAGIRDDLLSGKLKL